MPLQLPCTSLIQFEVMGEDFVRTGESEPNLQAFELGRQHCRATDQASFGNGGVVLTTKVGQVIGYRVLDPPHPRRSGIDDARQQMTVRNTTALRVLTAGLWYSFRG